jgi:hypothetical protein
MSREMDRDELLDLLAEKAAGGLDAEGTARLEVLLAEADEKDDHFELAAAALELAAEEQRPAEETLPAGVEARLRREGRRFAAGLPPSPLAIVRPPAAARPAAAAKAAGGAPTARSGARLPWLVAAVFFFAALTGWWRVYLLSQAAASGAVATLPTSPPAAPSPAVARAALLSRAVPVPWTGTEDPAAQGVAGDVVWSPERQEGFLRFEHLPSNDPKVYQYQLWIFDATRDDRFPIDGGVFDVPAGGEVVIPIAPRLPVGQATLFAVTIEKPGGAVVSSRDRIVLVAKPV